jgi:hypothetical protein
VIVRSLILSALAVAMISAPAFCEDEDTAPAKPTRVLEGGVRGTVLLLDEGCARITLARELIQESAEKIMKEATRKDTIVMRGPNAIGNGIVIPALGGVGGVMQMGEMPIRKDRLDRYVSESEQNIAALQNYVDALQIPAEKSPALDPVYVTIRATMDEAQLHLAKLKELSAAKRLKNGPIGKEALKIYDAMQKLEKQRGQLLALANASNTKPAENSADDTTTTTTKATQETGK